MKMFHNFCKLILLTCLALMLTHCGGEKEPTLNPGGGDIVGTWNNSMMQLVIKSGNTFDWYKLGLKRVWGTYTISEGQITFIDTGGEPTWPCESSIAGTYNFTVDATTLVMSNVNDTCGGRIAGVTPPFTRQ
jgi:hypothetical protein